MKNIRLWIVVCSLITGISAARAESGHRIGGGVNYWVAVDDLGSEFDESGLSYLASYQYRGGLIGMQLDVEYLADLFAEDAYAPAGYIIIGNALYGALGVGMLNYDGDWADDPFFAAKIGFDLELLPSLYLDLAASYRFESDLTVDQALDDVSTDTVFLGAAVRLGF